MKMHKPLFSILLLGGLMVGVPASASDLKIINGTMCELEDDSQVSLIDRGGLRVGANHGQTVGIVCPLLRANTTNTNGLLQFAVKLFKQKPATFTCYGESHDQNGSALKIVSKSITTTGNTVVDFGNTINTSMAGGTYGVVCYEIGQVDPDEWGDEISSVVYEEP
jgi:hypothetical protein